MLSLMLHPRLKNLHLMDLLLLVVITNNIVEEYDERSLHPMLVKCYHHLHQMVKFESEFVEQIMDANCNLDIFEMTIETNEPSKNIVKRQFLIFKRYQVDANEITCPLEWWERQAVMFPIVGFLAWNFLKLQVHKLRLKGYYFQLGYLLV